MNPYSQYLPGVLGVFGFGLQWLRQNKSVHDTTVYLIAFIAAACGYVLCFNWAGKHDWQLEIIGLVLAIPALTLTVIGGTFTAARMAAGGIQAIPTTNSK